MRSAKRFHELGEACIGRRIVLFTSRASSTDNFPLGASETSATSVASTSILLSPASDILNVGISHESKTVTNDRTKEYILFDSRMLQVMSSSAFVDTSEN